MAKSHLTIYASLLRLPIFAPVSDTVPEEDASNDEEDDESGADVSEIRFIPSNKESRMSVLL